MPVAHHGHLSDDPLGAGLKDLDAEAFMQLGYGGEVCHGGQCCTVDRFEIVNRLLLIDGHSMAYRAFFALPAENFTTSTGQHTNAVHGFTSMLIGLLTTERPTHVAVAFDVGRESFRNESYPDYKATRSASPVEFRGQVL